MEYQATRKQINLLDRRVRIWYTPSAVDCYTVAVRYQRDGRIVWDVYGMSHDDPNSPQGFNQYSHTHVGNTYQVTTNAHTKRKRWANCPLRVVNAILKRV